MPIFQQPQLNTQGLVPDAAGAQQNALLTQRMGLQNQLISGNVQTQQRDIELRPMRDEFEAIQYLTEIAPMIHRGNYDRSREWLIQRNGLNPDMLPPGEQIDAEAAQMGVDPAEYFEHWKSRGLQTMSSRLKGISAEAQYLNAIKPKEQARPELTKLIEERDALPPGDPARKLYDAAILKKVQQTGMVIRQTPDGGLEIIQGAPISELSKPTRTKIEQEKIGFMEAYNRLVKIQQSLAPKYLQIPYRFARMWDSLRAKLGRDLSPEDAAELTKYGAFRTEAIENINRYIKEFTGAQMSEQEAKRLKLAQPDPGENWWQGDDPITFKAKLDYRVKAAKAAIYRWNFYLNRGESEQEVIRKIVADKAMPLEEAMRLMDKGEKADQYEVGGKYYDAQGRPAIYQGNGKWKILEKEIE